ncbi:FixH family protein [bacterium]|nr:FixH family protein [bacterium]
MKNFCRKAGWYWPFLVAGFLTLTVIANVVTILIAGSDPSHAVEKDYYQKALAWDDHMKQERRNIELGWVAHIGVAATKGSEVPVSVRLTDANGAAIGGATITADAFFNALASVVFPLSFDEHDGVYESALPRARPGLWEFRVKATRGEDTFTSRLRIDLSTTHQAAAGDDAPSADRG